MKHIKLFMLVAAASLLAACSEDEVEYNSREGVTVEFEQTTVQVRENEGTFDLPVRISGKRDGNIQLVISTAGVGETPGEEGVNYVITDKTLNLKADTLDSDVINVEVSTIDDKETNGNRTFTVTIAEADGATIGAANTVTVTVLNDDGHYAELIGDWTLTAINVMTYRPVSCDVTISGTTDTGNYNYEKNLTATTTNLLGNGEAMEFKFSYAFDVLTSSGQIGWFVDDSTVGTTDDGLPLTLYYVGADGFVYNNSAFYGTWQLGPNGEPATSISFSNILYLTYSDGQSISPTYGLANITLTKN